MNSIWGRVTAAAILSLSVFGATHYFAQWYSPNALDTPPDKAIAFIKDLNEEAEKRAANSLVWKEISQGESLHPDEAVKTSSQGEVRIQFADSPRFLDLDPESLIVLHKENENEIALDLLNGSLFVHQNKPGNSNPSEPALILNSGQGKIDLSQATAQLSKSGEKVQVQVVKGRAKVIQNGQSRDLTPDQQLSSIEVLKPPLDRALYVNATAPRKVLFQWKGLPKEAVTSLSAGKTRKSLKEISKTQEPGATSLVAPLAAGSYFWKLTAREPQTGKVIQESSLFRLKIVNRYPPIAVEPVDHWQSNTHHVEFKWLKPLDTQAVQITVAKDPALKEQVLAKTLSDTESLSEELKPGIYYWRLSSSFQELEGPVVSAVRTFSVGLPKEVEKPPVPVVISWLTPEPEGRLFFIDSPKAALAWATEQKDQVRNWRLKLALTEEALKDEKTPPLFQTETQETKVEAPLPKPGRYLAMVEALDGNNQVLASSTVKNFEVSPLPLLPAPEFVPEKGDLEADSQGRLSLKWTQIQGAKEYWISLLDEKGAEIRKAKFASHTTVIKNLLPGRYQISVFAVDSYGRESQKSANRFLKVPEKSGLLPPKFKKIEVE